MQVYTKTNFACYRNDLAIRGTEYRPQGDQLPIAIISHGFMANQSSVKHYAHLFAERGYAAYTFDFSGGCLLFGKSDGKTTNMSVLTEVEDLQAVINHTCSLPYTDSKRITLMGYSQGGFVSALTAAKSDRSIERLILFCPAFSIPDDARSGQMMWAKFNPQNPPEIIHCGLMKIGRQYISDVIHMDPFREIRSYHGDVILIQGAEDKIVHRSYAQRAYASYLKRPKGTVRIHYIEGGEHKFSNKHDAIAISHLKEYI